MKKMITILLIFYLLFWLNGCATSRQISNEIDLFESLQAELLYLISDPNLANAQIGMVIEGLDDGKTLFRHNEHKIFIPASNMKLYTSAAALSILKPEFQFQTYFYTNGSLDNGTLNGDLIIRGMGDPTISGRFRENDIFAYFKDWQDSLKQSGIKKINGRIIADESFFSGSKVRRTWEWDDLPFYYAAQIGALSFNDNCIDLEIIPTMQPSDSVFITQNPEFSEVTIINRARTIHRDSIKTFDISRERGRNIITLSGGLPAGSSNIRQSITIEDPANYFVQVLHHFWRQNGMEISGQPDVISEKSVIDYDELSALFIHHSPPLSELLKVVNKNSNNFFTEQFLNTLGVARHAEGSQRSGLRAMNNWAASIGIAPAEFNMIDGSGLSRKNLISPFSTATLLRYMYRHPHFNIFAESLPIAGVDGTLRSRMKDTRAAGNVRAKTGFVGNTRCLSGYVNDADGRPYLFVIMINNYVVPTPYANNLQDKVCVLLSNFSRKGQ
jgi:serine-type D-Ala-D-Ala carboxypeptidase/endopeptidase (penicillin-binding protein 4)